VTPLLGPDGISMRTFEAIQLAVREMARQGHRIAECRIHVWEQKDSLSVSFTPPRALDPPWSSDGTVTYGCPPGPCSCWEVDLAPADLRVLASHGIR
jgi:hypothetical protein